MEDTNRVGLSKQLVVADRTLDADLECHKSKEAKHSFQVTVAVILLDQSDPKQGMIAQNYPQILFESISDASPRLFSWWFWIIVLLLEM